MTLFLAISVINWMYQELVIKYCKMYKAKVRSLILPVRALTRPYKELFVVARVAVV